MNTDKTKPVNEDAERRLNDLSEKVIGAAFEVSNTLGCGFLEKVYECSLAIELRIRGIKVETQHSVPLYYKGELVGEYFADLLVESTLIIELKSCQSLTDIHTAQCLNYLRATRLPLCLLLNCGKPHVDIKRLRI